MSTNLKDLGLLLDSKVPILVIESFEEPRVLEMITRLAVKRASPLYAWSITEGLNRLGFGSRPEPDEASQDATAVLEHIKQADVPGIYVGTGRPLGREHECVDDGPRNAPHQGSYHCALSRLCLSEEPDTADLRPRNTHNPFAFPYTERILGN